MAPSFFMSLAHSKNLVVRRRAYFVNINQDPFSYNFREISIKVSLLDHTFNQLIIFGPWQITFCLLNSALLHLILLFVISIRSNHFQGTKRKDLALPESIKTSIQSIPLNSESDVKDIVIQFREALQLESASLVTPEPETKSMIRGLALRAKSEKRDDLVRHLREITPAGTSGEFKMIFFRSGERN